MKSHSLHSFKRRLATLCSALISGSLILLSGCALTEKDRVETEAPRNSAAHLRAVDQVLAQATQSPQPAQTTQTYPIDLRTALRLGQAESYTIKLAKERIEQARAKRQEARSLVLPNLSIGASYYYQDGRLQGSNGTSTDIQRSGSQFGFGSGTFGAGPTTQPGLAASFSLSDAIYAPLAAAQAQRAAQFHGETVEHRTLEKIAVAYFDLLGAHALHQVAKASRDQATELAKITESFARSGEGLTSEAERAAAAQLLTESDLAEATNTADQRSVQLAELLRLPLETRFLPASDELMPIEIVAKNSEIDQLTEQALSHRPEVKEYAAMTLEAQQRLRQERYDPLLPKLSAGVSSSAFAGNVGSSPGDYEGRSEFSGMVFWEVRGLGLGHRSRTQHKRSALEERQIKTMELQDQIRSEIKQLYLTSQSQQRVLALSKEAVERAQKSYELNQTRAFENQGLPIEALQSISSLTTAHRRYAQAITDYNQTQFRLYTALGQPTW